MRTLSRARGQSDNFLYVALEDPALANATAQRAARARSAGSLGQPLQRCVANHSLPDLPSHANGTCASGKPIQLSEVTFEVPAHAYQRAADAQLCYRAFVMLRHRHRMVADVGLRVTAS